MIQDFLEQKDTVKLVTCIELTEGEMYYFESLLQVLEPFY